jgi:hypothetical protein
VSRAILLLLAGLVGACSADDPCAAVAGTCLTVHVDPSATVTRLDRIDLAVTFGANSGMATTHAPGGGLTALPLVLALELGTLPAAPAAVRVAATGFQRGAIAGQAIVDASVGNGEHAALHLSLAPAECKLDSLYCGGDKLTGDPDTLYRCNDTATPTPRGACPNGCLVQPGQDDTCKAGGAACIAGDFYCGGDKLAGDPQVLYRCNGSGAPTVSMQCPTACLVRAGQDDVCQ